MGLKLKTSGDNYHKKKRAGVVSGSDRKTPISQYEQNTISLVWVFDTDYGTATCVAHSLVASFSSAVKMFVLAN